MEFWAMQFLDAYVSYFRWQAMKHPDLLHSPDVGDRIFEVISIEEAMGDFRSSVTEKGFLMRLIVPTYSLGDSYSANGLKKAQGGFIISKYHSNRAADNAGFIAACTDSERVGFEIIEKMVGDSKNGHPLFNHSINTLDHLNLDVQPKHDEAEGGYYGWLFMFEFSSFFRNCPDATAWIDGGQTPFNQ
jgi:hypothetical protein